jgi:hypothetical protein
MLKNIMIKKLIKNIIKIIKKNTLLLLFILIILLSILSFNRERFDNKNEKVLVIVLSETRASELTFDNFKKNVIDELNADLCVCIGVKPDYDYTNPYYTLAKHHFTYEEPEDYGEAFEYAYNDYIKETGITPEIHWREFLKIKDQYLGGIKGENQHPGSAGILIFFRWYLLKKLKESGLINQYDRFVITRSDFIYQVPHPNVLKMNSDNIWIPDGEHYGGYTDRHVILSKSNIESYLNILNNMFAHSKEYFEKMKQRDDWNLEKLIKFNLEENGANVREFPYIMFAVRNKGGSTRWSKGEYNEELGYFIKYPSELDKSSDYKKKYIDAGENTDVFYKDIYN